MAERVKGLFVTGTDTGVGKTLVTAGLALALRSRGLAAGVAKPVQSGSLAGDPDGDAMLLRRWVGLVEPPEEIAPFAFAAPLAPLVAARLEGRVVPLEAVLERLAALGGRYDALLVEGAGGLLVPVGPDWTVGDLAAALGLPVLVVARPGLGTVNHTLLTVEAARRLGLQVAGVVLNGGDPGRETNAALIESFGSVAVVGQTPTLDGAVTRERLRSMVEEHVDLERLVRSLDKEEANV